MNFILSSVIGSFNRFKYLIFSAIMLNFSLYFPLYFFWLSFIWVVPVFVFDIKNSGGFFLPGFFWGLIFWSLHLYPLIIFIISNVNGFARFIFPVFLLFYVSLHSGIWFWISGVTKKFFGTLGLIFSTCVYLLWIPHGILWITGEHIGYPLSFPLLPLAEYPKLLFLLPFVGRSIILFFQVSYAMAVSYFFVTCNKKYLILSFFCLLPFFSWIFPTKEKENFSYSFFSKVGYINPPKEKNFSNPLDSAQEIYYGIRDLLKKYPDLKYIVMPELSFRFPLNEHKKAISIWNNVLGSSVHLLVGASRKSGNKIFNSLYWVSNGKIKKVYDKELLAPLVEYVPKWFKNINFFENLFLENNNPFFSSKEEVDLFVFSESIFAQPYICADIFFDKRKMSEKSKNDNFFILSILNDSIFDFAWFNHLFLLWNIFKSREFCCNFLYVGYNNSYLLTKMAERKNILDASSTKT